MDMGYESNYLKFQTIGLDQEVLDNECLRKFVQDWNSRLTQFSASQALKSRSASLKETLKESSSEILGMAFVKTPVINLDVFASFNMPTAIFQLDGIYTCTKRCGNVHSADIVIGLNNREAIGTNFLKLESSRQRRIYYAQKSNEKEYSVSFILTLNRKILDYGKWDNSYADTDEYIESFRKVYRGLLNSNYFILDLTFG